LKKENSNYRLIFNASRKQSVRKVIYQWCWLCRGRIGPGCAAGWRSLCTGL